MSAASTALTSGRISSVRLGRPLALLLPALFAATDAAPDDGGEEAGGATVPMREGDSVHEVAQRVGAEHGLAREGVTSLVQMITRKAAQVRGGSAVKTTFFELPVTVETAPGEQQAVKGHKARTAASL